MKYNVGDRVRIKSLDWYNENKDDCGVVLIEDGDYMFCQSDTEWCGKIVTIKEVCLNEYYRIEEDFNKYRWTDEMIEGLAEEEAGLVDNLSSRWVNEFNLPDGYIFKDEDGNVINATKIVLEKKKKEYPKTYDDFISLVKKMREAQKDVIYKSMFFALDSARPTAYEVAKTKQIVLEQEVDEYLKKMEE